MMGGIVNENGHSGQVNVDSIAIIGVEIEGRLSAFDFSKKEVLIAVPHGTLHSLILPSLETPR
jgi:hypothetical protein